MADAERQSEAERWSGPAGEHWVANQTRYDRMLGDFGVRAIEALAPAPGERVLDLGCGCGTTTLELARRVGPSGTVLGVDLSRPMLASARERAATERVANVRFVEADAETYRFEPASLDGAMSRFGVMFFADPPAAFTNIRGGLRPGGRLAFVCWQEVPRNEWIFTIGMAIAQHVGMPDMGPPGAPGPFAFADADRVRSIIESAGFNRIAIDPVNLPMRLGSNVDDAIGFFRGTDIARRLLEGADPARAESAIGAVRDAITPFAGPEGVRLGGAAWLVTARVP